MEVGGLGVTRGGGVQVPQAVAQSYVVKANHKIRCLTTLRTYHQLAGKQTRDTAWYIPGMPIPPVQPRLTYPPVSGKPCGRCTAGPCATAQRP